MRPLHLEQAYCLLKLSDPEHSGPPLSEQILPYMGVSRALILDVDGIVFNSMRIGELVNVHKLHQERISAPDAVIALVRLTRTSRAAFERVRLDRLFALCDSFAEAIERLSDSSLDPARQAAGE